MQMLHAVLGANIVIAAWVAGLVIAGLELVFSGRSRTSGRVAEVLLRWYLVCSIALRLVLVGLASTHAGDATTLAASLGLATAALVAAWAAMGARLAVLLAAVVFFWGRVLLTGGTLHGRVVLFDLAVPAVGLALLVWQYRAQARRSVFARSRL